MFVRVCGFVSVCVSGKRDKENQGESYGATAQLRDKPSDAARSPPVDDIAAGEEADLRAERAT